MSSGATSRARTPVRVASRRIEQRSTADTRSTSASPTPSDSPSATRPIGRRKEKPAALLRPALKDARACRARSRLAFSSTSIRIASLASKAHRTRPTFPSSSLDLQLGRRLRWEHFAVDQKRCALPSPRLRSDRSLTPPFFNRSTLMVQSMFVSDCYHKCAELTLLLRAPLRTLVLPPRFACFHRRHHPTTPASPARSSPPRRPIFNLPLSALALLSPPISWQGRLRKGELRTSSAVRSGLPSADIRRLRRALSSAVSAHPRTWPGD